MYKKYTLLKSLTPEVKDGKVIKDNSTGGIKLIYQITSENKDISLIPRKSELVVFLKPYKQLWAPNKESCRKGEWGSPTSPYSNVWLQIKGDYTDIKKDFMFIRYDEVKDHEIIGHLNREAKEFELGFKPKKLSATTKLHLFSHLLIDKIKSKF